MYRELTSEQSYLINSLKKLNLTGNYTINKEGWMYVFKTISSFKVLQYLSLSLCELDDNKVDGIQDFIRKEHPVTFSLQKLSLNYNAKITKQGWSQIFYCIANFKKLESLSLNKCELNDQIISMMVFCLSSQNLVGKSLKRLSLNNNPNIHKQGYVDLVQFLQNNCKSIQSVKIDDNGIEYDNFEQIVSKITKKSIRSVNIFQLHQILELLNFIFFQKENMFSNR